MQSFTTKFTNTTTDEINPLYKYFKMSNQMKQVMQRSLYSSGNEAQQYISEVSDESRQNTQVVKEQDFIYNCPLASYVRDDLFNIPKDDNLNNMQILNTPTAFPTTESTHFKLIENKLFIDCGYVMNHPDVSIIQIKQKMGQMQITSNKVEQQKEDQDQRQKDHFQWTQQLHLIFAIAALAFGLKSVTPKQLSSVLKIQGLNREKVASHLQKFRIAVAKHNDIQLNDIQNYHIPKNIANQLIQHIQSQWSNQHFQGFKIEEIEEFLEQTRHGGTN